MNEPRLHLDADISIKALQAALVARGHDVSRTPNAWIVENADDETQLLAATSQRRCIATYNVRDFVRLARRIPDHAGVILVTRPDWTLSGLIAALDRLLSTCSAEDLIGQVRWLSEWRR
jgi:hypothetical protein